MRSVPRGFRTARLSLILLASLAGRTVAAQEPGALGPEVTSVLGTTSAEATLDADVMAVLGQPAGAPVDEAAAAVMAKDIDSKLRCPVCQGVSIADSPSGMATNMRAQVRDLVARGYSEEQVMSYFERSYGEFVRLEPPLRGLNWMLWIMPALLLALGGWFVFRLARRPRVATATAGGASVAAPSPLAEPASPETPADPDLARYLERIRRDSGTQA